MNIGEIAERLIQAAEIERNIAVPIGPAPARSLQLPYAHDFADMNGWGKERLEEEQREFVASVSKRPTHKQVSEAEEAGSWYSLVTNQANRYALSIWVEAMAGGRIFKDACFKAGIHPVTGRRRKDRALCEIAQAHGRKALQNNENASFGVLPDDPEIEDIEAILNTTAPKQNAIVGWAADDAFTPFHSDAEPDFSWSAKRNEQRRKRAERKKAEEAKRAA
ncbi:hypothetical protein NGM99_13850 [Mesorhizobium sp. RP14(2022)]|uniref:Uncharacterized protein n=1 Tax=Mesorhizobium liriopis TaxID=2953882 RepID=A0ABT1C868_9HYPH|nr:hypothetical protein [Mesorhizobium liriopis]MCO6050863.1 hypothetical protein [Mesorhizobium liriopis]